jgi:predicted RNase H-like HicB family nuclease
VATNVFVVIHEAEEGGYWGEIPFLDGCFAQGETIDDLLGDARHAIRSHLDALRAEGLPVPPVPMIATVTFEDEFVPA